MLFILLFYNPIPVVENEQTQDDGRFIFILNLLLLMCCSAIILLLYVFVTYFCCCNLFIAFSDVQSKNLHGTGSGTFTDFMSKLEEYTGDYE